MNNNKMMTTFLYRCEIHGELKVDHMMNESVMFCPKCKKAGKDISIKLLAYSKLDFTIN